MSRKVNERIVPKFAAATGSLMTRAFSTPLETNQRGAMFSAGPVAAAGSRDVTLSKSKFDVVGLGFIPGREWRGPKSISVEEMRGGEVRTWFDCQLWSNEYAGPLYLVIEHQDLCSSFDGFSLYPYPGVRRIYRQDQGAPTNGFEQQRDSFPMISRRAP